MVSYDIACKRWSSFCYWVWKQVLNFGTNQSEGILLANHIAAFDAECFFSRLLIG